jgi:hypothetical protein
MKTYIKLTAFSLIFMSITGLHAQQPGGIVVIQSGFDPVLTDAFKINSKATIVDTVTSKPVMAYNIESVTFETKYTPMPINPAKISGEPITRLYRNLIKVGMGNYTTPYVELFLNNTRSSKTALGAHIKHINSNGSIEDYAYPGYANSDFELYGKQIFPKYTLEGSADYNRNQVQYYGFNPSDYPSISTSNGGLRHLVNLLTLDTKLSSNNNSEDKLKNNYRIKYHYLQDNNDNKESALLINTDLSQRVKWLKFTDYQTVGGIVSLDYLNNKWDTLRTGDYALVKFQPFISTTYNEYQLKLGVNAVFQTETGKSGNFNVYPFAEAKFTIIPTIMSIKAGVTGDIERVSYKRAMEENPFLGKNFDLSFEDTKYKFYAAFESNLSSRLQLNIYGDASKINQMVFYVTDSSNVLKNTFNTVIDDAELVHLRADISYYSQPKWSAILSTNYYQYTPSTQDAAWHKPVFEISLLTNYNIQDKIVIQANAFLINGIVARDVESGKIVSKSLNSIFDFNLGLEYRYTKNLGAFLNINNIASTRNYQYYRYPSQRFNFMLGISYSFGGNQPTVKNKKAE